MLTIISRVVSSVQRITVYMNKIVIKILQGSVVTQTAFDGLAIYLLAANFL